MKKRKDNTERCMGFKRPICMECTRHSPRATKILGEIVKKGNNRDTCLKFIYR